MTSTENAPTGPATAPPGRRWRAVIFLAVFGGYAGQQILTPVLPPLARELSMSEVRIGAVMSVSAAVVAVLSPFWGRRSDVWGHKRLLVGALLGIAGGLLAFAACVHLGLNGLLTAPVVFAALLLTRGVLFGGALAALPVAAQSYVAGMTHRQEERVRGVAAVGASIGLALVLGPGLGGLLGDLGLVTALYLAPLGPVVAVVLVWWWLPTDRLPVTRDVPARLSPFDARVRPFLAAGLGVYLSIGVLQSTIGFLVQDRLRLDAEHAAAITGIALLAGGAPMLVVQGLVIPRLRWSPRRLLRVGVPVAAAAFVLIAFAANLPVLLCAVVLSGVGHSLAVPGFTSAPGLRVGPREQGGAAGLVAATNAVGLIVGPLAGTALYRTSAGMPFLLAAAVLALVFGHLLRTPGARAG